MPKLTPEQRADLEAQLAEDDDDEDDEVTVTNKDGSAFTGSFRRAVQLGYVKLPAAKGDSAANTDKGKTPPARNVSPFSRRTG